MNEVLGKTRQDKTTSHLEVKVGRVRQHFQREETNDREADDTNTNTKAESGIKG
jgi:hypothetical protein